MRWLYYTELIPDEAEQARDEGRLVRQEDIDGGVHHRF